MKNKSIYQNQCPQLRELFASAQSPAQILIVSLDFARDKHLVLFCNGLGDALIKPFPVHNDQAGVDLLNQRIRKTIKRCRIDPAHVLLGGEDDPSYAKNFLWALHQNWLVLRVNAFKAKKYRENIQASSDELDLLGIAKMLLNREAAVVFNDRDSTDQAEHYYALKALGRARDALVRDQTRLSNRIHSHVKILFPGFLSDSKNNPIKPFSNACLDLMEKSDFTAAQYAGRKNAPLARTLKKLRLRQPEQQASQLIANARASLPPAPHMIQAHQDTLGCLVSTYRTIKQNAARLENRQAFHLAQVPAVLLTSLPGMAIINSSALAGELGSPDQLGSRGQMASYAGIIPRIKQTGGPDSPSRTFSVGHHCNHRLKNHLVRAATAIGQLHGPPEIKEDWQRLLEKDQHAGFIHARRLLATSKALMINGTIWLPESLRHGAGAGDEARQLFRQQMFEYLQELWPGLRNKWAEHKALELAFAPENPLGKWRQVIQQLYRIQLPLEELDPCMEQENRSASCEDGNA